MEKIFNELILKKFTPEYRIKYYLGTLNDIQFQTFDINKLELNKNNIFIKEKKLNNQFEIHQLYEKYILLSSNFEWSEVKIHDFYVLDTYKYLLNYGFNFDKLFIMFGDNSEFKKYPCLSKIRKIGINDYSVLLKLNSYRHISMLNTIKDIDIPFREKDNKIIWRGVSSGNKYGNFLRDILVQKYQNSKNPNFDIKFTEIYDGLLLPKDKYIKGNFIPIKDQLKSKFILSIEGNDVATNLKWALYSNSLVLMNKPKIVSWFMEDQLIPYYHYIPISDNFDDLEEKYNWCLKNLDKCEQIIKNANQFIQNFLDEKNESFITNEVIKNYFQKIKINITII
jgi:hypothetical protein